jgi:putative peptide zinc metalloprotease protein
MSALAERIPGADAAAPVDDGDSASEWVFPFAPPTEPREGDNQALAVNTQDGSNEVAVALALVWVTDSGPVDTRNQAYALASCTDCRTLAVAFQVVLVVGYAQVVTPLNAAVAVNYDCDACVTHALAVQLVATLAREPSPETMSALAEIWAQLEQSSTSFELLPLVQVYEELAETQALTLEILTADEGLLIEAGDETEPSGAENAAADGDVTPAGSAAPTAEPSEATDETTTGPDAATGEGEATTPAVTEEQGTTAPDEPGTTTEDASADDQSAGVEAPVEEATEPTTTEEEPTEEEPSEEPPPPTP